MQLLRLAQLSKARDLSRAEKLELAEKIDVNYNIPNDTYRNLQDKFGYNCLHIVAQQLDLDFIKEFVNRGADPLKQGTKNGKTPLHIVVDVKKNFKNKKIYEISGKLQDCRVVNTLLAVQVINNNPSNPKCNHGISHLHIACMFNNVVAVNLFLENRELINQVTNADSPWPSYTPLHFAIRYSSVQVAEILLNHKADLYAKNNEGASPLYLLINRLINIADYINMGDRLMCEPYENELKNLETIAKVVIKLNNENGVNYCDESGLTFFHLASLLSDSSVASKMLYFDNINLNLAIKTDSKFWPGWTPLHFAACSNNKTVELFMQVGADITIKNKQGQTPLDFCLRRYTPKTIHSILSKREEFKSILLSDVFTTLLDLILTMGDMKSLQDFLTHLNQPDICVNLVSPLLPGYSILHLALSMNSRTKFWDNFVAETDTPKNVIALPLIEVDYINRIDASLAKGCSVDFKNFDGTTPIHLAFKHLVKPDILEILLSHCQNDVSDQDGLSYLHIFCALGDENSVKKFLDTGSNVNATSNKSFQWYKKNDNSTLISVNANSTPLHVAVLFEHIDIIEILLDYGADVYAEDSEGFTPVHLSIGQSNESNEIAQRIVRRPIEWIDLVTKEGLSHMHVAAFAVDADRIEQLVRNGADVNRRIDIIVPDFLSRFIGKTPIQMITEFTRLTVWKPIRALIESGADVMNIETIRGLINQTDFDVSDYLAPRMKIEKNVNRPINSSGLTWLHIACGRFNEGLVKHLLDKGANVNARIRNDEEYDGLWKGYTPLHLLVYQKWQNNELYRSLKGDNIAKILLERGADVTIDSIDGTPLHLSYSGYMSNVKIDKNCHLVDWQEKRWPLDLLTSIMLKSQKSYEINPINCDGFSHFHFHCMFDQNENEIKKFLDNGVDIDHATNPFSETYPGYSGIQFAFAYFKDFSLPNTLIERGCNVNIENAYGNTPVHLTILGAVITYQRDKGLHLQRYGGNFNAKNLRGQTPADLLMTKIGFLLEQLQFLLLNGSTITMKENSSLPGPAALILQNAFECSRLDIIKWFVTNCDLQGAAVRNGYDFIGDVLSAKEKLRRSLTIELFIDIIQIFIDAGGDITKSYEKGSTRLHEHIALGNTTAVDVLLLLGVDVVAYNAKNNTRSWHETIEQSNTRKIGKLLALQVHKMKLLQLYLSTTSNSIYSNFKSLLNSSENKFVFAELEKSKTVKITETITMRDFLTDLKIVNYYWKLSLRDREVIDNFFKRVKYFYTEFPNLCGIILMQYRKAINRLKLIGLAREILVNECNMDLLPDLCLECILNNFGHGELEYLIDNSEETVNPCKRSRTE